MTSWLQMIIKTRNTTQMKSTANSPNERHAQTTAEQEQVRFSGFPFLFLKYHNMRLLKFIRVEVQ